VHSIGEIEMLPLFTFYYILCLYYYYCTLCVGITTSHLLPLAFSNFLPLALTYGLVCDPGRPGALPKCFNSSRTLGPLSNTAPVPKQFN